MISLNRIWYIFLKDPVVDISLEYLLEIRQILNYIELYVNEWFMGRELRSVPTGWDRCWLLPFALVDELNLGIAQWKNASTEAVQKYIFIKASIFILFFFAQ